MATFGVNPSIEEEDGSDCSEFGYTMFSLFTAPTSGILRKIVIWVMFENISAWCAIYDNDLNFLGETYWEESSEGKGWWQQEMFEPVNITGNSSYYLCAQVYDTFGENVFGYKNNTGRAYHFKDYSGIPPTWPDPLTITSTVYDKELMIYGIYDEIANQTMVLTGSISW